MITAVATTMATMTAVIGAAAPVIPTMAASPVVIAMATSTVITAIAMPPMTMPILPVRLAGNDGNRSDAAQDGKRYPVLVLFSPMMVAVTPMTSVTSVGMAAMIAMIAAMTAPAVIVASKYRRNTRRGDHRARRKQRNPCFPNGHGSSPRLNLSGSNARQVRLNAA